jgi:hypothetical protein
VAKLVRVSAEEAIDFGYPKSCLREDRYRIFWDFWLVDRRRRARMRRRGAKQRRLAHNRFLAQVAEIKANKERLRRDVAYFVEVCGMTVPSNHPGMLAMQEILADHEEARTAIMALPFKPPSKQLFDLIRRMERYRLEMYGEQVNPVLIGNVTTLIGLDEHG